MNFIKPSNLAPCAPDALKAFDDDKNIIGIRSEHLKLCSQDEAVLSAKFELVENLGDHALVHLIADDKTELIAKLETPPATAHGDYLHFNIAPEKIHIFNTGNGRRV